MNQGIKALKLTATQPVSRVRTHTACTMGRDEEESSKLSYQSASQSLCPRVYLVTSKFTSYCVLESKKCEDSAQGPAVWGDCQTRASVPEISLLGPHTHHTPASSGKGTEPARGERGWCWTLSLTEEHLRANIRCRQAKPYLRK